MNKYIGTELVEAKAMTYGEAYAHGLIPHNAYVEELSDNKGYQITYEDGYISWTPKDVFDKAYHSIEGMSFGMAIEALKKGFKVFRECWPKETFLWLKPAAKVQAEWCKDPLLKQLAEKNGGSIDAQGTICAHLNGTIVSGFTPLQEDMLAEDWVILMDYNEFHS